MKVLENILKAFTFPRVLIGGGFLILTGTGYYHYGLIDKQKNFEQTYHRALFQYADTNQDGFVSTAEKDEFDKRSLQGKNVKLVAGQPSIYANGTEVPLEVLTNWIKEYHPTE